MHVSPLSYLPDKDFLETSDVADRNTFPLLSLLLRLSFLSSPGSCPVNPRKSHCRATWQLENSHGQPVPQQLSKALFDQDKQGTSEGGGREERLQRQRNMFATYSFFIPTPSSFPRPRSPFPLPSGELNCRLPSRHSCARSSSPSPSLSLSPSAVPVFHPVTLRVGRTGQRDTEGVA